MICLDIREYLICLGPRLLFKNIILKLFFVVVFFFLLVRLLLFTVVVLRRFGTANRLIYTGSLRYKGQRRSGLQLPRFSLSKNCGATLGG